MKNATKIVMILDKSGSMSSVRSDTIGGFNTFIEEQKKVAGECNVTLVTFNHAYSDVFINKPLKDVELLNESTYATGGNTALLDAVGATIDKVGKELADMAEADRPEKVVFVIMTDGEENSSKEYNYSSIREKIKHQTEKYGWMFTFLGANIDAISVGANIGISKSFSANYTSNSAGTTAAYGTMSKKLCSVRCSATLGEAKDVLSFTDAERSDILDSKAATNTFAAKATVVK